METDSSKIIAGMIDSGGGRKTMYFAGRDLKPYAEPFPTDELRVGETYFGVQFLDEDGVVPVLEPKIFIGQDLEDKKRGKYYFQDYASYLAGVRYESATALTTRSYSKRDVKNTLLTTSTP